MNDVPIRAYEGDAGLYMGPATRSRYLTPDEAAALEAHYRAKFAAEQPEGVEAAFDRWYGNSAPRIEDRAPWPAFLAGYSVPAAVNATLVRIANERAAEQPEVEFAARAYAEVMAERDNARAKVAEAETVIRKVAREIANRVRQNCTPSPEAYARGGDYLIAEVADWIENPPEWVKASWVVAEQPATPTPSEVIDWIERLISDGENSEAVRFWMDEARENFASAVATPTPSITDAMVEAAALTTLRRVHCSPNATLDDGPNGDYFRAQARAVLEAALVSPVTEQPTDAPRESHAAEAERLLYGPRRTPMFEQDRARYEQGGE